MDTFALAAAGLVAALFAWKWWSGRRTPAALAEAAAALAEGGLLVDVRSPGEFAAGHAPGAINLPVQVLGAETGRLGGRSRPVILYCASGMRSAAAAATLRRAGFARVHDLGPMRNVARLSGVGTRQTAGLDPSSSNSGTRSDP